MILLLRLVIIGTTAMLSAAGLGFVVVALLAAQWLLVAGVVLSVMGVVGGAIAIVKRLARSAAGSGSEDCRRGRTSWGAHAPGGRGVSHLSPAWPRQWPVFIVLGGWHPRCLM